LNLILKKIHTGNKEDIIISGNNINI